MNLVELPVVIKILIGIGVVVSLIGVAAISYWCVFHAFPWLVNEEVKRLKTDRDHYRHQHNKSEQKIKGFLEAVKLGGASPVSVKNITGYFEKNERFDYRR